MQNPINALTSLDELIWKQFEKITHYTDQEFGYNKWDLVHLTNEINYFSLFSSGVSFTYSSFVDHIPFAAFLGGISIASTILDYAPNKKHLESKKQKENTLLHQGIIQQPQFSPYRPTILGIAVLNSLSLLYLDLEQPSLPLSISIFLLSYSARSYFIDQTPKPPTKKKIFFKTLYDKLNPFKNLEVPEKYSH